MNDDYITLEDGTLWPNPRDPKKLQWSLLHTDKILTAYERKLLANYIEAYHALAFIPSRKIKLPMIRRALKGNNNED